MLKTGAQIVMECLLEQGVDTVFGYPGGTVVDIYDALYEYSDRINHVLTGHEQGAAHAADGYTRATGRPGVVIATSGPGATNLVTGLATAYMDSIPMIAITGNVSVNSLGTDAFQEIDIYGVKFPITKYSFIVKKQEDIAPAIRKAFYIAREGRPGPVLIDILKNAQHDKCEYKPVVPKEIKPSTDKIGYNAIDKAARLISEAKRPFIFAGGGVKMSGAEENLLKFAEKIGAPISLSMMGLGSVPCDYPYFTGLHGMHGTRASAKGIAECDLMIIAGARMTERVTMNAKAFASHAKILRLDVDAAEVDKVIISDASVVGDLNEVLRLLIERLPQNKETEWLDRIAQLKKEFPPSEVDGPGISPANLVRAVARRNPDDALIVTDVGQHQIWTAQYYPLKRPNTFISSGGLGTMGFGMGAAIGCKMGRPDRKVVLFTGDGSFQMNCNEVITAVTQNLDITVIVVNNGVLGMVRQWQDIQFESRYSQTTTGRKIDYVKLAEAFGAHGFNASTMEELEEALDRAEEVKGTVIINVLVDKSYEVLPMKPPTVPAPKSEEEGE